ncbi:hypothetical protein NBRC116492_03940 [Aurantivibrio infirmus]
MSFIKYYKKLHIGAFNIGAKIFGVGASIVSLIFIIIVFFEIFGLKKTNDYPAVLLIFFIPLFVLSILIIRAKPFKLG